MTTENNAPNFIKGTGLWLIYDGSLWPILGWVRDSNRTVYAALTPYGVEDDVDEVFDSRAEAEEWMRRDA